MEPSDTAADESTAGAGDTSEPSDTPSAVNVDATAPDGISVEQWLSDDKRSRPPSDDDETVVVNTIPSPPQLPTSDTTKDEDADDGAETAEDTDTDSDATMVMPVITLPEPTDAPLTASIDEVPEPATDDQGDSTTTDGDDTNTEAETGDDAAETAKADPDPDLEAKDHVAAEDGADAASDAKDGADAELDAAPRADAEDDPDSTSDADAASDAEDGADAEPEAAKDDDAAAPGSGTDEPTAELPMAEAPADQTDPTAAAAAQSGGGSPLRPLLIIGGVLVGAYLIVAAAWAIDSATHRGQAMRGVHLDDIDVGGADREELSSVLTTLTDRLGGTDLEVTVGDATISTDPVTLGAIPDSESLIDEALEARRGGLLPLRPVTWAAGLFSRETIAPQYTVDPVVTRRGADAVLAPELDEPVEPELDFDGDELALVPGSAGVTFDPELVIERLPAAVADGEPYELDIPAEDADPDLADDEVEALADELNGSTSEPIAVRVLDKEVTISPNSQRSWIRLDTSDGDAGWTIDEDAALEELRPLFPVLGSEDQQARFEVVDEEPIIIPASETVVCCATGAGEVLADAIAERLPVPDEAEDEEDDGGDEDAEPVLRTAALEPEITGQDEGVEELESLGIVEQVSTFTTNHACCQNRVENIQRFADLTQGVIIRPGEEFSLNGFVGRRTRENGFVADGAIAQGIIEPQVGGGISQYATTFFNASFFAGIEFLEYQSHSIYISRYPRGREATISWPKPDLKVLNTTPYGILVWNDYTPTSITVSFYSTKHLEVEALERKRSSDRQCRIDITPRLITFEDGTTAEDSVFGLYRPGEGFDCNGNSTRPEEPEPRDPAPEPEPEPDPEPDPEPEPDPDPEPDPGGDGGDDGNDDEVLP